MPTATRNLEARDKARWLVLFTDYIAFYRTSVTEAVIEAVWQQLLSDSPGTHVGIVAVDTHDQPIGLAHILFHRSTWSLAPDCYLEDLFVAVAERGSGAGRALIEAVYAEADRHGARRTYWVTEETNWQARALYDQVATRAGFVQYRR